MSDPQDPTPARSEAAEGHEAPGEAPTPTPPHQTGPLADSQGENEASAELAPPQAAPTPPQPGPYVQAGVPHRPPPQYGPPPPHHAPPLSPDQAARQAAYYQHLSAAPPRMIPPNPRWHRPELSASQTVVLLVAFTALFGAWAAFHPHGVGIGLALTGIALVAVPLATGPRSDLVPRLPGAVLVALLWSVAAVRDAGWVVALCAFTAFVLTPVVLAPQRRIGGTVITLCFGWLEGLAASFGWLGRSGRRREGKRADTVRNLRIAGITLGLLIVFGGLFAAADDTFARLASQLLPELDPVEIFLRLLLAAALFVLVLLWAYMSAAKPRFDSDNPSAPREVSRMEIAIPLAALNLLFAAFIVVQARVFFGGEAYVMETTQLTFAEYARKGFWQLSFVAVLVLVVLAFAGRLAPKRAKTDRWTARVLLGALALMSLVVVASASYRMAVYFDTYGLTRLRVWVFTVEIWLAVLFVLVLVCCWKLRAGWLPRGVLASGAVVLLGLAAANPDALIARYNIEHDHELDYGYLSSLSADAVPELLALSEEQRSCWRSEFDWDEREALAWNWGYQQARGLEDEFPEPEPGACFAGEYRTEDERFSSLEEPDEPATAEEPATPAESVSPVEPWTADPAAAGFFRGDMCAAYNLVEVTEFFGTSAKGDRGVENDAMAQYGEPNSPETGGPVLHCGYYGPGSRYLMIEVYLWPSYDAAFDGVEAMQAKQAESGVYEVAPLDSETTAGYTAVSASGGEYEYAIALNELVVSVYFGDAGPAAEAETVAADLVDQTWELYVS